MTLNIVESTVPDSDGSVFVAPEVDNSEPGAEYPCKYCGQPLTYGGRGRKPSKCTAANGGSAECIAKRAGTGNVSARSKGSNEKLAKDAVAVLTSMHDFMALGAMMMQLMGTAQSISTANEAFIPRAEAALSNDPVLCRKILKMGSTGGKAMLIGAYAAFIGTVAPTAVLEVRAMRAARQSESE